jgi:purine-binding chemotaxis protein CheW
MSTTKQFCTFYLHDLLFGIEVEQVQEVFRHQEVTEVPLAPPIVKGLINLRGQIITTIDLRRQLQMEDLPDDQKPNNIVLRQPDGVVSLLVDEIGDVLQAPDEAFEPVPETLTGPTKTMVRGVYKLENQLLLVLDTTKAGLLDN